MKDPMMKRDIVGEEDPKKGGEDQQEGKQGQKAVVGD